MFGVIGGALVYGLALYGVMKLFDRRKAMVAIRPNAQQHARCPPDAAQ